MHRWLAIALSLQIIIWGVSGAYMVWMKLSFIHGNHLAKDAEITLSALNPEAFAEIQRKHPAASTVQWVNRGLLSTPGNTIQVQDNGESFLYSPSTLEQVHPTQGDILNIANRIYRATDNVPSSDAVLLEDSAPRELFSGYLPVWQVTFDDWVNTTLYFKAETGELVTRRFSFWRGFDFFWMLHIMDYKNRENIQTPWLIALTGLTICFVVTGGILTTRRLRSKRKGAVLS